MNNLMIWSSYLYLCLLGLIGAIYSSFMVKKFIADKAGVNYNEGGFWGIASDIVMYPILVLYAITAYHLLVLF